MYLTKMREISFNNKYTKWYLNICQQAQQRATTRKAAIALLGYTERHHILPKSFKLSGEKDPTNFAYLSIEEHFLCHRLLTKMFSGQFKAKMNYAMTCFHRKSPTRILTSRQYATAVRFYKEKFDQGRCDAISKSRLLTAKQTCLHCSKSVDPGNYEQFHGEKCKLNPAIEKTTLVARSKKARASALTSIANGTHKHRGANSYGELICPYCQATGINLPNMKKNHFDRCKLNPNSVFFNTKRQPTMRRVSCVCCHKETNSGNFAKFHGEKCKHLKVSDNLLQS